MKFPKLVEDLKTTVYDRLPSSFEETFLHTENWLNGKRLDDGAEGLWRIHDDLYDFTEFIVNHPGGPDWLTTTQGTDITEAFEAHHISTIPESKLVSFFIRKASQKRYSPFTFKEDGFYRTLKKKVRQTKETVPQWPITRSKIMTDSLLIATFTFIATASYYINNVYLAVSIGTISGVLLALTTTASHNFAHQRDNFRMFYMNLAYLRSRDWRITHAFSHHLYTNTANDVEALAMPTFYFLPSKKHFLARYFPYVAFPVVFSFMFFGYYVRSMFNRLKFRTDGIKASDIIPFLIPIMMFSIGYNSPLLTVILYIWIMLVASFYFTIVGIIACHHHPDSFHDGDAPRPKEEMDWGISQLDAAIDRKLLNKSHFFVLTSFGDHILHHLFPTLDHGVLPYYRSILEETCTEFGIQVRNSTEIACAIGALQQLSRDCNPVPPKALKDN